MSTKLRQIITIEDSNLANATKKEYGYRLKQFFHNSTIKSYEELIDAPSEELEDTLITYCKFLLIKVSEKSLSPNTIPKMFKPIKFVLDVNYRENDVRWRPIEALFPPSVRRSGYKAWTTEQIQEMLEQCTTSRNKSLIHFMASIGGRVGIHDHALLMKHLIPMSSLNNDTMDCYAVLLYAEEDESAEEKDIRDSSKDTVSGDESYTIIELDDIPADAPLDLEAAVCDIDAVADVADVTAFTIEVGSNDALCVFVDEDRSLDVVAGADGPDMPKNKNKNGGFICS